MDFQGWIETTLISFEYFDDFLLNATLMQLESYHKVEMFWGRLSERSLNLTQCLG